MYKVFVADKLAPEGIAVLEEYPQLTIDFSPGLSPEEACEHAKDADAIIVRSATKLRGALLEAAKKLRVVGRAGIGVDNIDLDAATERGIVVLNTPDANATTTAELAVAHIFSLSRNITAADRSVRAGEWTPTKFVGAEITGKIVGILGFGTIGRLVAERCLGLNMKVIGCDPFVTAETFSEHGVESRGLDEMLAEVDYLSLHCPVTDDTRGILNRERIGLMKQGARLINCARGGIVDEEALLEAVESGHLGGAALDVFEKEPPGDSPLFKNPRISFTPHLGASTHEAQTAVGVEIAQQIAAFLVRGEIINSVNVSSVPPDKLRQLQPYMDLARKLGRLVCLMSQGPLSSIEIGMYGRAAELDTHPIATAALAGLLSDHLDVPVNQVNAMHLARRQGIRTIESSSPDSRDYLSVLSVVGTDPSGVISMEGTLFDEMHPRLIRINNFAIEAALEGHLLFTRHADQPGVVGAIGDILGRGNINISHMQVGVAEGSNEAMAILGVSQVLSDDIMQALTATAAIDKVLQVNF